jgi:hypothetical protein
MIQQHSSGNGYGHVSHVRTSLGKTTEIDQRSDIFRLAAFCSGVTGKTFEGDSVINLLHSLIYEPAPLIRDLNPLPLLNCKNRGPMH